MDPLILHLSGPRQYGCWAPHHHHLPLHSLSLSVLPSSGFLLLTLTLPAPQLSFRPHPLLPSPSRPPRCSSKSILSLWTKPGKVRGVIRRSSRGRTALLRLLRLAHKHAARRGAPAEVRPSGARGPFLCTCECRAGTLCVHAGRG